MKFLGKEYLLKELKLDLAQEVIELWADFKDMWDTFNEDCLSGFTAENFKIFTRLESLEAKFLEIIQRRSEKTSDS